jgi:hypothetical protein
MLPIAATVGRITIRRLRSLWTMVGSGVLAHKSKKERLEPLFFDTSQARQIGRSVLKAPSFGRFFFWPAQLAGL